jgi:hypothetical protein
LRSIGSSSDALRRVALKIVNRILGGKDKHHEKEQIQLPYPKIA